MQRTATVLIGAGCLAFAVPAFAQRLYIYPQKGQSQQQQDIDNAECGRWAKAQSGVDPSAPPPPGQPGQHAGGTLGGAARGAGLGAAVGAIAGDAGKGAAAGAAVGGVAGRRRSKIAQQAKKAEATSSYQRAFAACMEGRGYTVK
ncbi:MAG: hypothetical protein ACHQ9S_14970 [Candidatus Binatia bacterium]